MDPGSLPTWAQAIFYIVIAIGAASTAIIGYVKKQAKEDAEQAVSSSGSSAVISASFIDSKLLKELIEGIREIQDELGRDAKKSQRLLQDVRESVNELNESIIVQTDTTMNLVRFINREANKSRIVDVRE